MDCCIVHIQYNLALYQFWLLPFLHNLWLFVVISQRRMFWGGFIFGTVIRYHACKIAFGSLPNLSNSGKISHTFGVFVVIFQRRMGWFLFIFDAVIRYHVLLIYVKWHLAVCEIWEIMAIFFLNVKCLLWSLRREWVDFGHIWYSYPAH